MDPAMMGGAPPMDPAMAGGMPPPPPMDQGGAMPPLTVSAEDLMALFQEVARQTQPAEEAGAPGASPSGRVTNRELRDRMDGLEGKLDALANALGVQMPAAEVGAGAAPGMPAGEPADLAALVPPPAPPPEVPKMARADARQTPLLKAMRLLKQNR
jgi:hypothetical protein